MRTPSIFLLSSIFLPLINAQQVPDGLIVPFTSVLPACASLCGKLFDVQGACTPPNIAATSNTCFCADPRLKPFLNTGTSGVATVCTAASCTDTASLQKIQNWYESYCNEQVSNPTTTSGAATATGTGAGSSSTSKPATPKTPVNQTWIQSHWKWVVMIIVIFFAMIFIWVGAILLKRRYQRKKEREIEMKPPIAWGPHQMQNSTSGYNYGDGVMDASGAGRAKEARSIGGAVATPADSRGAKRESKGWLRKNRN